MSKRAKFKAMRAKWLAEQEARERALERALDLAQLCRLRHLGLLEPPVPENPDIAAGSYPGPRQLPHVGLTQKQD